MPLVDYGSSDEGSEHDSEVEEIKESTDGGNKLKSIEESEKASDNVNTNSSRELFSSLPQPRKTYSVYEDNNKLSKLLLNKNILPVGKKESVKIFAPSITEFDNDVEQPVPKKLKPNTKSVGLFSVLPPPKNTFVKQVKRSLVPHAVSKRHINETDSKLQTNNTIIKETDGDEDDDDTPVGSSFFGSCLAQENSLLDSCSRIEENNLLDESSCNFSDPGNSSVNEIQSVQDSNSDVNEDNHNCVHDPSATQSAETAYLNHNSLELDEKALQILCGNKKKRQQMPVNIIDLSGEEVLPDSKEWLLKQFTEEKRVRSHSHKKNQGPSSQSRRKHQITYLAYQAKEQELELQNQWANNRMSRKQTQSKYGF